MSNITSGLYIVSTPIGNLEDITIRAINVLKNSDFILCEDTRHSFKLLKNYNIKSRLISYHKFNEKKSVKKIIGYLNEGKILSLICDAGTPTLSDPGNIIINECISKNYNVFTVPGPSAITSAVSLSGFNDKFLFVGFLPKKEKELEKNLKELTDYECSLVFFIPGVKLNFYIKHFKQYFTERKIFIAREMTKKFETYYREDIANIDFFKSTPKGELTVIISSKVIKMNKSIDYGKIEKQVIKYLQRYKVKDIVKLISEKENISKKIVYNLCLKQKK